MAELHGALPAKTPAERDSMSPVGADVDDDPAVPSSTNVASHLTDRGNLRGGFESLEKQVVVGEWTVISSGAWQRPEHVTVLEGRAIVRVIRRLARDTSTRDHR
eukprot:11195527-Lingulodinium_polyedra.AAC.1